MRLGLLLAISLACGSSSQATSRGHGSCGEWRGTYVGRLAPADTFTGLPTRMTLTVQPSGGVAWSITGEGVPEILLAADRHRCSASQITGSFSGSHMRGSFTLKKRRGAYVFDLTDVGGSDAGANLLGYAPNRPITVRRNR